LRQKVSGDTQPPSGQKLLEALKQKKMTAQPAQKGGGSDSDRPSSAPG